MQIKKILIGVLFLFLLSGCYLKGDEQASVSEQQIDYMQRLAWVKTADADEDAKAAIAKNDLRLLVIAGRGETTPGLAPELSAKLKPLCGKRYLEGSTDVIRSNEHQQLLQQAFEYATSYNRLIATACH